MGRGLSMGIQYLQEARSASTVRDKAKYQIACSWFFSSVSSDFLSMNFQAISNSSVEPHSKPWESWKIKLLPGYVIWCSISCRPLCYLCMWMGTSTYHWLTHLKWWHQMNHRLFKLIICKKPQSKDALHKIQTDLPSLSYIMGFVVTINTLYAPMRQYPVCFSLLLYYDATLPMLDWYGHHHSILTTSPVSPPVWPWLLFYLHTIPCSLVPDTSHLYSLIRYAFALRCI